MARYSGSEHKGSGLDVQNVSKKFHELTALDGVSIQLQRGEVLGLIGPNGSGKSTLINVISGVLPLTSGSVRAGDTMISRLPPHRVARAGVARTFQGARIFPALSVEQNIVVAGMGVGASRRVAQQRTDELLEYFAIESWRKASADSLPYGHKRIVEVARGLAMNPRFLMLDEPGAGLDESESEELLGRLTALPQERNLGLLIVDHDMPLIMRLCHRIHVLNYGQSIAEGTPAEIRHDPAVLEAYLGRGAEYAYDA